MSAEIIKYPGALPEPEADFKLWWRPHNITAWAVLTAAMENEAIAALAFLLDYCYTHDGKLPNSDAARARIARLSGKKFARHRDSLMAHFDADGCNAEISASLEKGKRISAVKREAGRKGGASKALAYARQVPEQNASKTLASNSNSNSLQEEQDLESSSTPSPPPSLPRTREGDEIAGEVLAALPVSARAHPGWRGFAAWIDQQLTDGAERVDIVVGALQCLRSLNDQPPKSFSYFAAAIARAREARTRPLPQAGAMLPEQPHNLGHAGDLLRQRLGNDVFASWFNQASIIDTRGDTMTIAVDTKFKRSRILAEFETACIDAFKASNPSIARLVVIVEEAAR